MIAAGFDGVWALAYTGSYGTGASCSPGVTTEVSYDECGTTRFEGAMFPYAGSANSK